MTANKTGNENIAEFMGVEFKKGHTQNKYWHYDQLQLTSSTLIFDTSWDWLMPVVEKISSTGHHTEMHDHLRQRRFEVWGEKYHKMYASSAPLKELVYQGVIEFITWYQNNKQPKQ